MVNSDQRFAGITIQERFDVTAGEADSLTRQTEELGEKSKLQSSSLTRPAVTVQMESMTSAEAVNYGFNDPVLIKTVSRCMLMPTLAAPRAPVLHR
jgi:hypothetical protein